LALSFHTLQCRPLFFHDYCIERLIFLGSMQPYLLSRIRSWGPCSPSIKDYIFLKTHRLASEVENGIEMNCFCIEMNCFFPKEGIDLNTTSGAW
jgi:hypothetical protein